MSAPSTEMQRVEEQIEMGTMMTGPRPDAATEIQQLLVRQRMAERIHEAEGNRLARSGGNPGGPLAVRGIRAAAGWARASLKAARSVRTALPPVRRMRAQVARIGFLFLALVMSACSAPANQPAATAAPSPSKPAIAAAAAAAVASHALVPTEIPTPVPPKAASCTSPATAATGTGVTIYQNAKEFVNSQIELTSAAGHRVLIDVGDSARLSSPGRSDDILLTTHEPQDAVSWYEPDSDIDTYWLITFPGQVMPAGASVSTTDFKIVGTLAAHGSTISPATIVDGTDSVEMIEVGGLRIADFGDFGQFALTQEQLDRIGRVDVAITSLDNEWSGVTMKNKLAFDLIAQVCPRVVIPSGLYNGADDIQVTQTLLPVVYTASKHVLITPANLPKETTVLLLGDRGATIGKQLQLASSPWK